MPKITQTNSESVGKTYTNIKVRKTPQTAEDTEQGGVIQEVAEDSDHDGKLHVAEKS